MWIPTHIRKAVRKRDGWACQRCGKSKGGAFYSLVDIHHIKPRALGGTNELENLITLCKPCHSLTEKGNRIRGFLEEREIVDQINAIATAENVPPSEIVGRALRLYLKEHQP